MNCSNCKNPVDGSSVHCEWCGAKIDRQAGTTSQGGSERKHPTELLLEKLLEVDSEAIEASGSKDPISSIIKGGENLSQGKKKEGLISMAVGLGSIATGGGLLDTAVSFINRPGELKAIAEKKATIISAYPLPRSNAEDLLEMANLATSSFNQIESNFNDSEHEKERKKVLKNAWRAKAEQAIEKLEMFAIKDEFIKSKVVELKEKVKQKKSYTKAIIFGLVGLVILAFLTWLSVTGNDDYDTEKLQLETILEQVNLAIQEKDFETAKLLLNDMRWEYNATTAGGAEQVAKQRQSWEKKRQFLLNMINGTSENPTANCDKLQVKLKTALGKLADINNFKIGRSKEEKGKQVAEQELVIQKIKDEMKECDDLTRAH